MDIDYNKLAINIGNMVLIMSEGLIVVTAIMALLKNHLKETTTQMLWSAMEVGIGWVLHRMFWLIATITAADGAGYNSWFLEHKWLTLIAALIVAHGAARLVGTLYGFDRVQQIAIFAIGVMLAGTVGVLIG